MDLENAFNQMYRSCFLCEVCRAAPGLTRYCDLCCSDDSFVLFGLHRIPNKRKLYNRATIWDPCSSPSAFTGTFQKNVRGHVLLPSSHTKPRNDDDHDSVGPSRLGKSFVAFWFWNGATAMSGTCKFSVMLAPTRGSLALTIYPSATKP